MLVGDFPSQQDLKLQSPFNGIVGEELLDCLTLLGLKRYEVALTNVFNERPEGGSIDAWAESRKGLAARTDPSLPWCPIPCKKGVVAPRVAQNALKRLHAEVATVNPNVIVTLGATATAALTGQASLTKTRGSLQFFEGRKVIPTYALSGVLKNYDWKPVIVMDLAKAKDEAEFPEARLVNRKIYIRPTLGELALATVSLKSAHTLAIDIETKAKQITCIGFAPSPTECWVVPFWDNSGSYWASTEEEVEAYKCIREICQSPAIKVFQNGMYDITYLEKYGIAVNNFLHDTMLFSHALYPALPKSLGFLGSLYANERAWKRWRLRGEEQLKREE
jgi:uracil-DNA glycosylase